MIEVDALKAELAPEDLREFYRLGGNDKKLQLVFEFLRTNNPIEAYIACGYSAATASSNAYTMLRHPSVKYLLARLGHQRLADVWIDLQPLYAKTVKKLGELALKSGDERALKYAADAMRPIMEASLEDADREANRAKKALDAAQKARDASTRLTPEEIRDHLKALSREERLMWLEASTELERTGAPSTTE